MTDLDAHELDELLNALCEDDINPAQASRLSGILKQSPAARRRYLEFLDLHGALHWMGVNSTGDESTSARNLQLELNDALALSSPQIAADGAVAPSSLTLKHSTSAAVWHRRPIFRLMALAASLAVVIGTSVLALRDRNQGISAPVVISQASQSPAMLTNLADAQWGGSASALSTGAALAAGQSLDLRGGCISLRFAKGATVVVEGPARFTVQSPTFLTLAAGKIRANVPGGGFVVVTPVGVITDLGTEFGVHTSDDGSTSVEVFAGSVQMSPAASGTSSNANPRVLFAGQASRISANGEIAQDVRDAVPQRFVRQLSTRTSPTSLDIVDLLSGGDGTTHRRGYAIDPRNGTAGKLENVSRFSGDGRYHTAPSLPVVDGCFIPAAADRPMQVTSAGHRFAFPQSASGHTYNLIWLGGAVPKARGDDDRAMSSILDGVDYAADGRGHIALHAGKGLTIDLDQVRRLHPGRKMARFTCVAGNTWRPLASDKLYKSTLADLFVLIDGKAAYERHQFLNTDAAFRIDLPINPTDRFLTVAVTDGGDSIRSDWVVLGDPQFMLSTD